MMEQEIITDLQMIEQSAIRAEIGLITQIRENKKELSRNLVCYVEHLEHENFVYLITKASKLGSL